MFVKNTILSTISFQELVFSPLLTTPISLLFLEYTFVSLFSLSRNSPFIHSLTLLCCLDINTVSAYFLLYSSFTLFFPNNYYYLTSHYLFF